MKSEQERKLSMFMVFALFIQGTLSTILASIPNFNVWFDQFVLKVNEINVLSGKQMLNRRGNRFEKVFVRDVLCFDGDDIASKIMAYASYANNFQLFNEVKYTNSSLLRLADTACKTACLILHEKGVEYLAVLADYGITQTDLDKFKDTIDLFDLTIPKPKTGIHDKKLATDQMRARFGEASKLIGKMYIAVKAKKRVYPDFVTGFEIAKRIDKAGFDMISARGVVVDEDGNRIGKVTMECKALNFRRRTSASGGFYLKRMPDGVYEYTFSRPGWESIKVEMIFYRGTRFEVRVVMKGS